MFAMLNQCIELRPLLPQHAEQLASCVDTHRAHLATWTVIASRVMGAASACELLEQYAQPPRYFGLWDHGDLVGAVLYRTFDIQTRLCEVGGWLTPQAQAQGLVTLAFRQMIAWAFDLHGMYRVELRVSPDNIRGRRIAQRLGMIREALLRNAFTLNGRQHDSEVWSLLASDRPRLIIGRSSTPKTHHDL